MGFFDFLKGPDINQGVKEYSVTDGVIDNKATPIFVHCLSGARSRQASAILQQMGYTNVKNIGGISTYAGKVER